MAELTVESNKSELKEIIAPVQEYVDRLEDRLLNEVSEDSRVLKTIMQDIFRAGGKRIRPVINFLVYKALLGFPEIVDTLQGLRNSNDQLVRLSSEELEEKIFLTAELTELIHTASLVHDDIIDNSLIRRGAETTNSKWDNAVTVISGDFMFARAAVNLGKLDCNPVVCLYAKVLEELCQGEIEQVEKKYNTQIDWEYYYSKTYKKTASLIEAAAMSPVHLIEKFMCLTFGSHSPNESLDYLHQAQYKLRDFGSKLGIAFQVVDDLLDYTADEKTLGKPAGADIKDGQVTMPALYALEELQESDKDKHEELVTLINKLATGDETVLPRVLDMVKSTNAIEKTKDKAREIIQDALADLEFLPDSIYKQSLVALAGYFVERKL